MKVFQLIKFLEQFDGDASVCVKDSFDTITSSIIDVGNEDGIIVIEY